MNRELEIKAPAKINLFLDVGEKLANGYHRLTSVMQSVSLCDTLKIMVREPEGSKNVRVLCDHPELNGPENIVFKAAQKFFDYAQIEDYNVEISVQKRIPMQAGLGGGSSDAAAVLRALNRLYQTDFSAEKLKEIGIRVGSDVPFCIVGGTCVVGGIGEEVEQIASVPDMTILVAMPQDEKMSTAEAYRKIDSLAVSGNGEAVLAAIRSGNPAKIGKSLFNKFEFLMSPESETIKVRNEIRKNGAAGAMMSGSGTAVFGLFFGEEDARKAALAVSSKARTFLCRPCGAEC